MEHRCSIRKPIEFQLLLYKHGLPVQNGTCCNIGLGGMFINTGENRWHKNEYLEVEILSQTGITAMRLAAVVVHQNQQGMGVMFDAVTGEQRQILRTWLFGRPLQDSVPAETVRAVA
ncbi:hypothetical protein MNBD_GAMMA13-556 [hydrothermal vent metagenome]|uniref:PilZ domain-containing protein n=1 Tax=hydrothermal vent metagenome TaxID=652676 RepID=A0A3B0YAY8_9ZZZZ